MFLTFRSFAHAWRAACAVMLIAGVACHSGTVGPKAITASPHLDKPAVNVALLAATSGGSSLSAIHAMQGARLAFDAANEAGNLPVDILSESSDTKEDPAATTDALSTVVNDPSYVAVVGWPSPAESGTVADTLATADLTYINLSPAGWQTDGHGGNPQIRMVATDTAQVQADAAYIAGPLRANTACVAGDDLARGTALSAMATHALGAAGVKVVLQKTVVAEQDDYSSLVDAIKNSGCDALFWVGGGTEAGVIRTEMVAAEIGNVTLVGVDTVRTDAFLEAAGPAGDGTIASCPCLDVSTLTSLQGQQFIQAYQSKYGSPPAPFAAEGYDAGQRIVAAIAAGNTDRASIAQFIAAKAPFDGIAGPHQFASDGSPARTVIQISQDERGDWVVIKTRAVTFPGKVVNVKPSP